jgi:hypothetical protein
MRPHRPWRAQLLWVAICLGLAPSSVSLCGLVKRTTGDAFTWHSRPSVTTEYWQPSTQTFAPGPALATSHDDALSAVLDDGSILLLEQGAGTTGAAERLDPASGTFVPTGPLAVALPQVARLLPAPGGALVIGVGLGGPVMQRYDVAKNLWSARPLADETQGVCAQRIDPSRLLLITSSFDRDENHWETHGRVLNLATGDAPRVALPFVTLDCQLSKAEGGSMLLVANVEHADGGATAAVRAFTLAATAGQIVITPVPTKQRELFVPRHLRRRPDGTYRLVRDDRAALLDPRTGAVTSDVALAPPGAVYPSWAPSGSDAALFVGGQVPTADLPAPSWDVGVADEASIVDLATGRRHVLPPLATPRMRAFVTELPDGRLLVGGGRERHLVVRWAAIAKCVGAWLSVVAILVGLALLARRVRPRLVTIVGAIVLVALVAGIWFLVALSSVRLGD